MSTNENNFEELANAIQNLANASATSQAQQSVSINAVSLKLPEFWPTDPELWFTRIEAQFAIRNISSDDTKFNYVVGTLDNNTATEVKPLLIAPPSESKYESVKAALISAFGKSQLQKDAELLSIAGMGDMKPTSLLRKLQSLNNDADTLRRAFFLAQLPSDVRVALAAQNIDDIQELAKAADRVIEMKQFCTNKSDDHDIHVSQIQRRSPKKQARDMRHQKNDQSDRPICYYHRKFGTKAFKCEPGCIFADLVKRSVSEN